MKNSNALEKLQQKKQAEQAAMNNPENIFLTPDRAAEVLDTTPGTLAVWRSRGHGPKFHRIGKGRGAIRYRLSALLDYAGDPRSNTVQ